MSQSFLFFVLGSCFMFLLWAGAFFCFTPKHGRLKKVLGCVFFLSAILYLKDFFSYQPQFYQSDYLINISLSIDAWMIAAWALFLTELIRPGKTNVRIALIHSIPFIFFTILFAVTGSQIINSISRIYYALYGFGLYFHFLYHSRYYNKVVKENYSYNEGVSIQWVYIMISILAVYFVSWFFVSKRVSSEADIAYFLLSLGIWIIIVYKGYYQEAIIPDNKEEEVLSDEVLNELKPISKQSAVFEEKMNHLIYERCIFLNPKLTLPELASEINTNRTYLSNYLNSTLNMSFSDYVNSFRLAYACKLLAAPTNNDTIDVIAEKSGFNSPSTFRRVFMEKFNYPPKLHKKKMQQIQK